MRNIRTTPALLLWLLPFAWAQQYTISTVAGIGTLPFGGEGARATSAFLVLPRGVAADSVGNIFVSDQYYNAARTSVFLPVGRATIGMNVKDLSFTFEGAYATPMHVYSERTVLGLRHVRKGDVCAV